MLLLGVGGLIYAVASSEKPAGVDLVVPEGYVVVGSFEQSLSSLEQARLAPGDRVTLVLGNPDDPDAKQHQLRGTITTISDELLEIATDKNWAYEGAPEGEVFNGLYIEKPGFPVTQIFAADFKDEVEF